MGKTKLTNLNEQLLAFLQMYFFPVKTVKRFFFKLFFIPPICYIDNTAFILQGRFQPRAGEKVLHQPQRGLRSPAPGKWRTLKVACGHAELQKQPG